MLTFCHTEKLFTIPLFSGLCYFLIPLFAAYSYWLERNQIMQKQCHALPEYIIIATTTCKDFLLTEGDSTNDTCKSLANQK